MTFNRKYAICVKLSRIEFHLAVMKQNTLITNFHQRQSQKTKELLTIIGWKLLNFVEGGGDLMQKLGGLHMDSPYIKCKNKICTCYVILQQQKKNTWRKTYKNTQLTEKCENISGKTTKGLLLDPRIWGRSTPFRSKVKLDEEKLNQMTNNKVKKQKTKQFF